MTRDKLCSEIAKRENKKVSVSMANVREVMRIIIDLQVEFNLSDTMTVDESPVFIILNEVDKKLAKKVKKKDLNKPKTEKKDVSMIEISWTAIIMAVAFVLLNAIGMYLLRDAPLGW